MGIFQGIVGTQSEETSTRERLRKGNAPDEHGPPHLESEIDRFRYLSIGGLGGFNPISSPTRDKVVEVVSYILRASQHVFRAPRPVCCKMSATGYVQGRDFNGPIVLCMCLGLLVVWFCSCLPGGCGKNKKSKVFFYHTKSRDGTYWYSLLLLGWIFRL